MGVIFACGKNQLCVAKYKRMAFGFEAADHEVVTEQRKEIAKRSGLLG